VQKATDLGIVGPILDSIRARIKVIKPDDASLQTQVVEKKVEVQAQPKVDEQLERALERIKEIAEGSMSVDEKVRALKAIAIEGQRTEQDLITEIQELQKRKN
jgi:type I site-specific restriction endonuclease